MDNDDDDDKEFEARYNDQFNLLQGIINEGKELLRSLERK
jgi:hypothetical protein